MTTTDSTTVAQANRITAAIVIAPDPRAILAQAQAEGNAAYDAAGPGFAQKADAYHLAVTAAMRRMGQPIPCACDLCHPEAYNPTEAQLDEWADYLAEMAQG